MDFLGPLVLKNKVISQNWAYLIENFEKVEEHVPHSLLVFFLDFQIIKSAHWTITTKKAFDSRRIPAFSDSKESVLCHDNKVDKEAST